MINFTRKHILESVDNSLDRLCVDYVDLIQVNLGLVTPGTEVQDRIITLSNISCTVPGIILFSKCVLRMSYSCQIELKLKDIYYVIQVHDVEYCASLDQIVDVTIPALVELKKAGKCRFVVSRV